MSDVEQPITGKTKIIPILADPIAHVETPRIMNMLLRKANYDAVCVPFQVAAEDLSQCVQSLKLIPTIAGAVVTVPHKMTMAELTQVKGSQAQIIGAVNAVRFDQQRQIHGEMFDGKGFVQGLIHNDVQVDANLKVYMAGAGGVARGIAFALLERGVKTLRVHNRTQDKAEELVKALRAYAPDADITAVDENAVDVDLCINATSAGMLGALEHVLPFSIDQLRQGACVAEVVMNPPKTQLLLQAESKGMKTVPGQAMLMAQIGQLAAFILDEPELALIRL
ncbi:shikimate dehydrogenase family protein [Acinetobacter rudis]|uniref:shikimate dehydrogenase (NADP(+)) n=1 Tax=Acinetobacter rudis TaxID=632955 RepID=A0AAW8JA46_9GAMM|nr:shikimate dehydrogenase [Acinetobacter rudis]MDQ8936044.1 shikimate dehydrogenase [Acinetobacter rudis]MDQ9018307.1 shikimate dehydrogenase [Acinetobacter rudis]